MSQKFITADDLRVAICHECDRLGSQRAFARKYKICPVLLSAILNGTRSPGVKVPAAMGYVRGYSFVGAPSALREAAKALRLRVAPLLETTP